MAVIIGDPDDLKIVLNSEETFEKNSTYRYFFSHGMLVDSGEKYKLQRKTLSPMFNPSSLRLYIPIINEKFDKFLRRWDCELNGNRVDARDIAFKFTFPTVARTIFDLNGEFEEHTIDSVRQNIEK